MKINLLLDEPDKTRQGYMNIDQYTNTEKEGFLVRDNLKELSSIDDGECEEVLALNILEYFPPQDTDNLINCWARKLQHGGLLVLGFTDIYQLVTAITTRALDISNANTVLHGVQDKPWNTKKTSLSMELLTKLLEAKGLKIYYKRLQDTQAIIKAARP